ncbi:hypothetical protein [Pseudomonas syringae]|uniref:hypothetical protein n=1 Tax=Pseudomonas syringae TaxID=317 RepID=UPI000CDA18E1|nr:hypothetical protein [Pseudomonas syringae]POP70509.1 hypothetical protein CXB35_08980 [Pseudomonas syringae]
MTALNDIPAAPIVVGGVWRTDTVTKGNYVQLGYPDKPSSPLSLADMAYLAGRGLSVRAASSLFYLNFVPGDHVQMNFKGRAQNGTLVSWSTSYTAQNITNGDVRTLTVPSDIVKSLAGQTATLQYVVRPGPKNPSRKIRSSYPLTFQIRGLYLPAPDLLEAINGSIDPDHISVKSTVNFVTVSLDYPGMQLGDTVRLVREGVDVKQKAINFTEQDRPISSSNLKRRPATFTWAGADLKPLLNGIMNIYYKVYRDGVWYTSPKRTFYVGPSLAGLPPFITEVADGRLDLDKLTEPGKPDVDLIYVHIPPAGTLVGDKVTLFWSDSSKQNKLTDESPITALNVDTDMKFDVYLDNPIEFNRGKIVTVFYRLERVLPGGRKVSFTSADYQFFVGSQKEQEAADSRVLTGAVLEGIKDGKISSAPVSNDINLIVPFAETQEGDSVTAYWQPADGGAPIALGTQAVYAGNVNSDLKFIIPAATVNASQYKKASVYYIITRKGLGGKTMTFESLHDSISIGTQLAGLLLPAPEVPASVEELLDPMAAQSGTKVVVQPYPTIAVGDTVQLFWIGTDGPGTPDIAPQTVSDVSKALEFVIPASAIGASTGAQVWVYYEVTRKGLAKPIDSEDTLVDVEMIGLDDLPVPVIAQAPAGLLDLVAVKGDIVVTLKKWPFIAAGQRVWLQLQGTAKDGSAVEINAWTARLLTDAEAQKDVSITISRAEFDTLAAGSLLSVFAKVTLDGDFNATFAEAFPTLDVTIILQGDLLSVKFSYVLLTAAYPKPGSNTAVLPGSSQLIEVSGGTKAYKFEVEEGDAVEVDENGLLMARKNGIAYVLVKDAVGQRVFVTVTVEGIATFEPLDFSTYTVCKRSADSKGLVIPDLATWRRLRAEGGGKLDINFPAVPAGQQRDRRVWASDSGVGTRKSYYPDDDSDKDLIDLGAAGEAAYGFGLKL